MSPGAKIFLALAGVGAVIGVIAIAATPAKAASGGPAKPKPLPGSNVPPDVVVPEPGQGAGPLPQPPSPIPSGGGATIPGTNIPLPGPQPPQGAPPGASPGQPPGGTTFTLPNPLGGPPLGTYDPATGNVFGPAGVIIGTFDPATGIFTGPNGEQLPVPGFPSGAPPLSTPAQPTPATPSAPTTPGVQVQLPTGTVTIPLPPQVTPPNQSAPASGTTTVAADTAQMVAQLLDEETRAGWNKKDPIVGVWQAERPPLKSDQKFGPASATMLAREIGTLPLIRFWPLGSTKAKAVAAYQAQLNALANASADPAHAQQLRYSAQREQGQAYSTKGPLPPLPLADQVALGKVA